MKNLVSFIVVLFVFIANLNCGSSSKALVKSRPHDLPYGRKEVSSFLLKEQGHCGSHTSPSTKYAFVSAEDSSHAMFWRILWTNGEKILVHDIKTNDDFVDFACFEIDNNKWNGNGDWVVAPWEIKEVFKRRKLKLHKTDFLIY